jgi:Asp/Glu/hydantoin racemase
VAGIDPDGPFGRAIRFGSTGLDVAAMRDETVAAARRLQHGHPDLGAILLECANMPPYRDAVASATGLPVFDASEAVRWFHAGLERTG